MTYVTWGRWRAPSRTRGSWSTQALQAGSWIALIIIILEKYKKYIFLLLEIVHEKYTWRSWIRLESPEDVNCEQPWEKTFESFVIWLFSWLYLCIGTCVFCVRKTQIHVYLPLIVCEGFSSRKCAEGQSPGSECTTCQGRKEAIRKMRIICNLIKQSICNEKRHLKKREERASMVEMYPTPMSLMWTHLD